MKNKKAFTLVELIIVVAIITISSAVLATGFSYVSNSSTNNSINKVSSILSYTRVNTISGKPNVYLEITKQNNIYTATVYANSQPINTEKIGENITVLHQNLNGDTITVDENEKLYIKYDLTGAINSEVDIVSITVKNANKSARINITPATGYHEIA